MDEQELRRRTDANYVSFWSLYGSMHDSGEVREKGGIVCVDSGTKIPMLNNAFVVRPLSRPEEQIADVVRFFDARKTPFCVRITEGLDSAAERACESLGLPYSDSVPGMALENMRGGGRHLDGLEIRIAHDEKTYDEHIALTAAQFGFPIEIAQLLYSRRMLEMDDTEFYVGYVDGEPVAASALYVHQRVAGIYNVATDERFRRRGIGEAMTWQCVQRGASMGCIMAALQASDMGRPIYERMGFRLVSPYRTFHRPGV